MTKFATLVFPALVFLSSCGADQAIVDKMTTEICTAMDKCNEKDPLSVLEATGAVIDVMSMSEEYGDVTETQFEESMKNKCPEGYKKFLKMTEIKEE